MDNNFYNFNNGFPYFDNSYQIIHQAKINIKKHSIRVGICILVFLASPYILGTLLQLFGLYNNYLENSIFQYSVEMLLIVAMLFLPFFIVYITASNKDKASIENCFEKPKSRALTLSATGFGLMLCFAGDYISTWISAIFESIGITLTTTAEVEIPTSGAPLFMFAFSTIVVPAVIEEFTMRAVTMQPLRKYGDKFAIVMTALVFGLMHRNAVQGIFAFIAGAVFGYIAVATNSVWTAVIVHALNNGFYVLINVMNELNPDLTNKVYPLCTAIIFVVGIICAVPFSLSQERHRLKNTPTLPTLKQKTSAFILNLPMVVALIWMLIYTLFGDLNG